MKQKLIVRILVIVSRFHIISLQWLELSFIRFNIVPFVTSEVSVFCNGLLYLLKNSGT